jgi:anti-anti-sigma regulatory factor
MSLTLHQWRLDDAVVVTPQGLLDVATYRQLRDHLATVGSDDPRAVIVDLSELHVESGSALSVFTTAHTQLSHWPGVPLVLADGNEHNRRLLAESHAARSVPVRDSVRDAVAAIGEPPPRLVDRIELVNSPTSPRVARFFVRERCDRWGVSAAVTTDAALVVNELVSNVVRHTSAPPRVRIELRRGTLSVAVSDDRPGEVVIPDPGGDLRGLHGLLLVAQAASAWGCRPTSDGGKVVWATFRGRRSA